MKKQHIKNFTKGWFIGDFAPSLVHTREFEVAVKYYQKGDRDDVHYHKIAQEYTVFVAGVFSINGERYTTGDIIHFEPNDISKFECIEDGATVVVKIPSVAGDKYIVE